MALDISVVAPYIETKVVNVATVPMRSPFRYPGGKTWLIPQIRQWLGSYLTPPDEIVEPFAGGAIVSITAVFENLVEKATLLEIDSDIASVWHTIIHGQGQTLADEIAQLQLSPESVEAILSRQGVSLYDHALATVVRNRISRGGILAPGAGIVKNGENGKGLTSRWYPKTLQKRILDIVSHRERIRFLQGDGVAYLRENRNRKDCVYFIDPPYTVAGRRLYTHSEIDHRALFEATSSLRGDFLMTYDNTPEIRYLAQQYGFSVREIVMKNTHHSRKLELLISRNLDWLKR